MQQREKNIPTFAVFLGLKMNTWINHHSYLALARGNGARRGLCGEMR